jgi:hypothetical protein
MRTKILSSLLATSVLVACGGNDDPLTQEEAKEAVQSVEISGSAQGLTFDAVDISTHFTIGKGVVEAAAEIKLFAITQIPCADITIDQGHVTIDFGDLSDTCTYHGRTYAGVIKLDIERSQGEVLVHHTWTGLTDGKVVVNGDADVSWSKDSAARHVTYDVNFTHPDMDRTMHATGDVTQKLIDANAGISAGVQIDGSREWTLNDEKTWTLDIEGVQVRGLDPVPQSGTYALTTPKDKHVTLTFERVSATTIQVTLTGPKGKSHTVNVISIQ